VNARKARKAGRAGKETRNSKHESQNVMRLGLAEKPWIRINQPIPGREGKARSRLAGWRGWRESRE